MSSTFVRAAEFWVPSTDRLQLEHGGGWYGTAARMAHASRDLCFGLGEGLPGRAWEQRAPVVLHSFEGSYFRRTAAALADGLTCGIALPIFAGEFLLAVVVLFCGDDEEHAGAIEVWHTDPASPRDLVLADGHYGRTAEAFEYLSRRTSFRAGTGLPGIALQRQAPVFLPDLGRASGFLRSDSAVKVGINRGLAVPCATPGPQRQVLAFLSALGTPIARRVELWRLNAGERCLRLDGGFCELQGTLQDAGAQVEPGQGSVGRCWLTGLPVVAHNVAGEPGGAARVDGLEGGLVFPVLIGARFVAAVALYF
jgi:GAF domain